MRVLQGTTSHPTATWVYEQVRREIPDISLGTVYRNLSVLRSEGAVLALEMAQAETRYDGDTRSHYHFRCEQCGRVFDVDEPVDQAIDRRVAERTGFVVSHHILEFRGVCRGCQTGEHPG